MLSSPKSHKLSLVRRQGYFLLHLFLQTIETMLFLSTLVLALSSASATPFSRQTTTLKAAAGSTSSSTMGARYFGAALAAPHLSNVSDPNFARVGMEQFSGATPENEMKWYAIFLSMPSWNTILRQ